MTKSEEWDERNLPRGKLPFTPKVLIGVGILVILITLLIAFATPPAYADGICNPNYSWMAKHINILCFVIDIHEQNERIIEKLDWNNCVLDIQSRYSYTSSLLILKACGEIP